MAISKQKKVELVAEYVEQIKRSKGVILADYRGLAVGDVSQIRTTMRSVGSKLQVVKNRLLVLALKEVGLSVPDEWLIGPTIVSFCYDEVPPVAKALTDAAKDFEALQIKGGILGASAITANQVHAIADLPSREVLLAQALGTINAPATQVAGIVVSGVRQVLNILQAYVDKLQESGGGLKQAAEPV